MSNPPQPPPYSKDIPTVTISQSRDRSDSIISIPLKSPRTARFAEATAVYSPVDPSQSSNPFKDPPTNHYTPQAQVSDIGFGYLGGGRNSHVSVEMEETDEKYLAPMTPRTPHNPLKSALKSPGAAPRNFQTILSPTFREEHDLEKAEKVTDKEQAKDLRSKVRVRWAKLVLRGTNFACSLIVLSMLSAVFRIFSTTKHLPARNGLPAWAPNTKIWPQITLLCIACVSLFMCVFIFYGYWRGGHRRAEKVAVYYTTFAVAFFIFSIVMWIIGAVLLNESKNRGKGQDMWGWACKDNRRKQLFQEDVSYSLMCRLQNWSLICCIIEVVVEVIAIVIYGITFYRYYTKRRLRKTMQARDRARSDLYLAQLKMQSAPNTPGLPGGLLSPRDGGWVPPQGYETYNTDRKTDMGDAGTQYATVAKGATAAVKPFALQAPPTKKGAKFDHNDADAPVPTGSPAPAYVNEVVPAAEGEKQYGEVSIPGAYQPASPGFAPQGLQNAGFDFGIDSRINQQQR